MKFSFLYAPNFLRFLIIGLVNTVFGYSIYWLLLSSQFDYRLAALCSTIIGIIFNYKTIGKYVFNCAGKASIVNFFMVYCFLYLLNIFGIFLFLIIGLNQAVGGFLMIFPCAIIGFFLNKRFVFYYE